MLQGTPKHPEVHHRRAPIVVCMLLGIASVVIPADCQSIQSQISGTPKWSTPLTGGEVLGPVDDAALSHWWTVFNDPILTSLEERALKSNLDLRAALSKIDQARANRQSASGSRLPSVSVTASASGARASTRDGADITHGNTAEFDVSWEPDFFGRLRKNVEAYGLDIQAAQENLRATMVTLTAEVALDYVSLRSYQAQIAVIQSNLTKYRDTYEMTVAKRESGLASELDVQQALENVQSTEATLPTLETNLQQTKNALAILLAERPGVLNAELADVKPIPVIQGDVAVGIPGDLIRRRPDIKSAERQVAAQMLRVGVAKANLYPIFTLSGTFYVRRAEPPQCLNSGIVRCNRTWSRAAGDSESPLP